MRVYVQVCIYPWWVSDVNLSVPCVRENLCHPRKKLKGAKEGLQHMQTHAQCDRSSPECRDPMGRTHIPEGTIYFAQLNQCYKGLQAPSSLLISFFL